MRIVIRRVSPKLLFAALALSFAAIFVVSAFRVWLAASDAGSSNPAAWTLAANLEPKNPEYWHQIGVYEEWDIEQGNLTRAARDLQRAAELDPWSDTYWTDLASVDEAQGKPDAARAAYRQAEWAYPTSPRVSWQFGSFLVRQKSFRDASTEIRKALTGDPNLTGPALSLFVRSGELVSFALDEVLPAKKEYYLAALNYFIAEGKTDAALEAWDRLLNLQAPLQISSAFPLINEMIHQGQIAAASKIWKQALRKSNWPADSDQGTSVVFNGGFEHEILNGGFGWRMMQIPGATFAVDSGVTHSGAHCLRVTFDGSANLNFLNLFQLVPVQPGRRYHFSAYLRTDGITTDSGVGFVVYDPVHGAAPQASTPSLTGTHPWTLLETDVPTLPDTGLIEIALRRKPSWKFDNKLRGTVWIDDVALVPAGDEEKRARP